MTLFERRLLVVMGKGGTGRTTVASRFAKLAATQGKRVVCVELNGESDLSRRMGLAGRSYAPRSTATGVDVCSLTAAESIDDFARRQVGGLAARALGSRWTAAFLETLPGLADAVQLGKVENMLRQPDVGDPAWDLCVVDAPATGHGLSLLDAASSLVRLGKSSPFATLARRIADLVEDRALTGIVLVTTPEALPVSETELLARELSEAGRPADVLVVHRLTPPAVPGPPEWSSTRKVLERAWSRDPGGVLAIAEVDRLIRRREAELGRVRALCAQLGETSVWSLDSAGQLESSL